MPSILLCYVPCENRNAAAMLAQKLLAKNLIACANLIDSQSLYCWKGKRVKCKETILFAKTLPEKESQVRSFIKKHHTYQLPCIASWKINVNGEYEGWVREQVTKTI